MQKPKHHIFVCGSFRVGKEAGGVCQKKGAFDLLAYLENEVADRGLHDVNVSATGCLKVCDRGPAIVIYPQNTWYGNITGEEALDEILDALEEGTIAERYELT